METITINEILDFLFGGWTSEEKKSFEKRVESNEDNLLLYDEILDFCLDEEIASRKQFDIKYGEIEKKLKEKGIIN